MGTIPNALHILYIAPSGRLPSECTGLDAGLRQSPLTAARSSKIISRLRPLSACVFPARLLRHSCSCRTDMWYIRHARLCANTANCSCRCCPARAGSAVSYHAFPDFMGPMSAVCSARSIWLRQLAVKAALVAAREHPKVNLHLLSLSPTPSLQPPPSYGDPKTSLIAHQVHFGKD